MRFPDRSVLGTVTIEGAGDFEIIMLRVAPTPAEDECAYCNKPAVTETDGTPRCDDHRYAATPAEDEEGRT